jgi:glycosyltransferase involved in cell wall biosynthesis
MVPRVIVAGLLRDGIGLGEASRGYAAALAAGGCDVSQHLVRLPGRPFPHGDPGPHGVLALPEVGPEAEADLVLVCLCPPEIETLRTHRIPLPSGRVNAGLWIWDVDPLPASWPACGHRFDEIWSPTTYTTSLIESTGFPVYTAPPALRPLAADAASDLLEPGRFHFLALADGASTLARKNPAGAIEAFRRAFAPGEGPRLVVKVWNADADPKGLARLENLARGRDDIVLVNRWLTRRELVNLLAGTDCLVSLHRAEGFGLPIFEALALGTPVVCTGFSGPMDFVDEGMAFLVPAALAAVGYGASPYPPQALWGEPDLEEAARCLRAVWNDPGEARRRSERGREQMAARLSAPALGPGLRRHVEDLLGRLGDRGASYRVTASSAFDVASSRGCAERGAPTA